MVGELSTRRRQEQNAERRLRGEDEISKYARLLSSNLASGGHEGILERDRTNADTSITGQRGHLCCVSLSLFFSFPVSVRTSTILLFHEIADLLS